MWRHEVYSSEELYDFTEAALVEAERVCVERPGG